MFTLLQKLADFYVWKVKTAKTKEEKEKWFNRGMKLNSKCIQMGIWLN
jgi:hypothetical protein